MVSHYLPQLHINKYGIPEFTLSIHIYKYGIPLFTTWKFVNTYQQIYPGNLSI